MNKIVRRYYPIDKLPPDLRSGLPEHGWVHVELDPEVDQSDPRPVAGHVGRSRNIHGDAQAVLEYVRSQREDR